MKANSKKLYDHYVEIGYTKAVENMLAKYPEFAEEKKEVKKVVKKE